MKHNFEIIFVSSVLLRPRGQTRANSPENTSSVQKSAGSTKLCLLVAHGTADAPISYVAHGVP